MKPCDCGSNHADDVAIVTRGFMTPPEQWQIDFVMQNRGKLVCFKCGGEVQKEDMANDNADHVTASTVTERLRDLGVI